MNGRLRRLIFGGVGVLATLAATRFVSARTAQDGAEKSSASAARPVESSAALSVAAGACRNFHANDEVFRSHVADPDIAQFVHYGPNDVGIRGLKPGSTSVTIWSAATNKPVKLTVLVSGELDGPKLEQAGHEELAIGDAPAGKDKQNKPAGSDGPALNGEPAALMVVQSSVKPSELPSAAAGPGLQITTDTNYAQQVPAISLETSGPVLATVGKIVEQQILVKNIGSVAADQVEVRGTVSIDAELISTEPQASIVDSTMVWRISKLPAGGEQKIIVRVKPLVGGELSCNTNVSFKTSASVKVQVREAKLKLLCEGPSAVTVGSEVRVTLTVINTGSATAENVRIRQIVPGIQQTGGRPAVTPLVLEVGTLEPGESRVLETASKATAPGVVHIKLVAEGQDGVQATAEHSLKVQEPKLTIAETGPDFRYLNRKATYQIAVSNPGDGTVSNLNVMVGLPEGLEFIDASHDGTYNAQKRTIAWTPGSLDSNRKLEYSITVMPRTEGEHLQRAVAWADNNLLVKADKITRVEGLTSLTLEVTDVDDPIEVGSETLYQLLISNKGSKTAERVQVIAIVPEGLKVAGIESPGTYRVQGDQLIFEPIASMAPTSTSVIQIRVKGTRVGSHAIRATLKCPAMPNTITTEESTAVYSD